MIDPRITRLAAQARPATKVAAKAALKAAGIPQTCADDLLKEVARLSSLRKTARADRIERRLGYCPVDAGARRWKCQDKKGKRGNGIAVRTPDHGTPGKPVRLPSGTPAQRLIPVRQAAVLATLGKLIDKHTHGKWVCTLTADPAKVGVTLDQYYTGEKSGKWRIQATDTFVTVPADWRVRVQRKTLAIVDGLMTLDASPLEAEGCELFAATWARRTGAKNIAIDHGYIARAGAVTYHGATADQAMTGLAKKARELAFSARLAAADLSALVAKCPDARVSVADARATGACVYGIRSWCAAVGLDVAYDEATQILTGSATLAEVHAAYQREPRPEARAAILHAMRRQRALIEAA